MENEFPERKEEELPQEIPSEPDASPEVSAPKPETEFVQEEPEPVVEAAPEEEAPAFTAEPVAEPEPEMVQEEPEPPVAEAPVEEAAAVVEEPVVEEPVAEPEPVPAPEPPVSEAPVAPAEGPSKDERTMAMLCHLLALSGAVVPLGSVLGPLVMWLIKRENNPYIDAQGKEAVNFQISILIYMIVSALLMVIVIGGLLMFAVGIFALVFTIIGAVKANNGEDFRYPVCIRFIK
ncbi:MAG: DUF4870 domain-containing protein [Kiritimatiellales bacterium]|nr:DUF4870 domain-containing protein [Kiritimatiellales bacterium]